MLNQVQKVIRKKNNSETDEVLDWKSIFSRAYQKNHPHQPYMNLFAREKEEIRMIADSTEWHFMTDISNNQIAISDDIIHMMAWLKKLILSPHWNNPKRIFVKTSFHAHRFEMSVLVARGISKPIPFIETHERLALSPYHTNLVTGWVITSQNIIKPMKEITV